MGIPAGTQVDYCSGTRSLRVVIAEDATRASPGLSKHLAKDPSIIAVRCSKASSETLTVCRQLAPCVLIAEPTFLTMLGQATESGATWDDEPPVKVLILTDDDDEAVLGEESLRMGCAGGISRHAPASVFARALQAISRGELWAPRSTLARLIRNLIAHENPRKLTRREKEILALIAAGHTNSQIANSLFISRETVRWHVRSIYSKLGVRGRRDAIVHATSARLSAYGKPPSSEMGSSEVYQSVG